MTKSTPQTQRPGATSSRLFYAFGSVMLVLFLSVPASADVQSSVKRIFELNSKIYPGIPIEAINALLAPPAETQRMSDKAQDVTRYLWLHGEMGVEVYAIEGVAYRVNITLRFDSEKDALRAMDQLTRQGASRYGGMPRFDRSSEEYYWIKSGMRFGFSKYNSTTVQSRCVTANQ